MGTITYYDNKSMTQIIREFIPPAGFVCKSGYHSAIPVIASHFFSVIASVAITSRPAGAGEFSHGSFQPFAKIANRDRRAI
jgi:hypothetical protein